MQIQYLYDIDGKAKFVVIPVELWEKLKNNIKLDDFSAEEYGDEKKVDISQFYGILKHKNIDVEKEVQTMRQEWQVRLKEQGL